MLKTLFDIDKDHYFGYPYAPVELVQYGDFQCADCAAVYPVVKMVQEAMGDKMKFIFRHYPVPNRYPLSLNAALAAEAAGMADKFWYMHDIIFENPENLAPSSFLQFAKDIKLDTAIIENYRDNKKLLTKVVNDFESGVRSGVNHTPAFFINGVEYIGLHDFESLYKTCKYVHNLKNANTNIQDMGNNNEMSVTA